MGAHSAMNRRRVNNPLVKNCSYIFCFQSICVYLFSSIIGSLYRVFRYNYLFNKSIPYKRKISECYCTFSYALSRRRSRRRSLRSCPSSSCTSGTRETRQGSTTTTLVPPRRRTKRTALLPPSSS